MPLMRFVSPLVLALALAAGGASPVAAQPVTTGDVQRLQDGIDDASRVVGAAAHARSRARVAAADRTGRPLRRGDLPEGQAAQERTDRAARVRRRSRPRSTAWAIAPAPAIAAGGCRRRSGNRSTTIVPCRPQASRPRTVSTRPFHDRFRRIRRDLVGAEPERDSRRHRVRRAAAGDAELEDLGRSRIASRRRRWSICPTSAGACMVPAGSVMRGVVSSVNRATRTERKGAMTRRLRSRHHQRSRLSDPRHRVAGAGERRHHG